VQERADFCFERGVVQTFVRDAQHMQMVFGYWRCMCIHVPRTCVFLLRTARKAQRLRNARLFFHSRYVGSHRLRTHERTKTGVESIS
jgi:hypothetical protein